MTASWQYHYDQAVEGLQAADRDAAQLIAAMESGKLTDEQIDGVMRATLLGLIGALVQATLALAVAVKPTGQLPTITL